MKQTLGGMSHCYWKKNNTLIMVRKFEISSLHPFLLYTVRGLPFSWIILQLTLAYTGYPENKMQYSYVPDFYTAIIITERRKFNLRDAF
jgi:hypothetical protein